MGLPPAPLQFDSNRPAGTSASQQAGSCFASVFVRPPPAQRSVADEIGQTEMLNLATRLGAWDPCPLGESYE